MNNNTCTPQKVITIKYNKNVLSLIKLDKLQSELRSINGILEVILSNKSQTLNEIFKGNMGYFFRYIIVTLNTIIVDANIMNHAKEDMLKRFCALIKEARNDYEAHRDKTENDTIVGIMNGGILVFPVDKEYKSEDNIYCFFHSCAHYYKDINVILSQQIELLKEKILKSYQSSNKCTVNENQNYPDFHKFYIDLTNNQVRENDTIPFYTYESREQLM